MSNVLEVIERVVCRMMFVLQMLIKGLFDYNCMDCFVIWMLPIFMSGSHIEAICLFLLC